MNASRDEEIRQVRELSDKYFALAERDALLQVFQFGDGQVRYVFRGNHVEDSTAEALAYIRGLINDWRDS